MHVCFLLKRTSGHLNWKGFLRVFLMTRATKKEQATTTPRVWKQIQWTWIMLNINKASRTVCNESCQKSQQLQFAEIRKMVSVDPAWNILTCASKNMDEEMSKLLAVKIIQTYTQLMKMQSETESQSSSSLSITVRRFISFWTIPC